MHALYGPSVGISTGNAVSEDESENGTFPFILGKCACGYKCIVMHWSEAGTCEDGGVSSIRPQGYYPMAQVHILCTVAERAPERRGHRPWRRTLRVMR